MTPLWREQAVHAIDVALAEAIYSLAVLPALIQRQTDVPASPTKLLGGADQFNRRWAEQYTAAATSLFGDSDQFSGFLCVSADAAACGCGPGACGSRLAMGAEEMVRGVGRVMKWNRRHYGV